MRPSENLVTIKNYDLVSEGDLRDVKNLIVIVRGTSEKSLCARGLYS